MEKDEAELRYFRLMVGVGEVCEFKVEFWPNGVGRYELLLPMRVEGSVRVANSPVVVCEAIKPEFIFSPSVIDFKRKIVTKPDRCYPKFMTVSI